MAAHTPDLSVKPPERAEITIAQGFCQPQSAAIVITMTPLRPQGDCMLRLIFAACVAAAPLVVAGQTIYKVQMPDGSVLFTDSVPAGAKVLEEREAKVTPRVAALPGKGLPPPQGAVTRPGVPPGSIVRPVDPNSKLGNTTENVGTLERELAVAKRRLELGREPLPGERRGLAGGGSRLTPEYESRIAAMERDVAATEEKLKRAYAAR